MASAPTSAAAASTCAQGPRTSLRPVQRAVQPCTAPRRTLASSQSGGSSCRWPRLRAAAAAAAASGAAAGLAGGGAAATAGDEREVRPGIWEGFWMWEGHRIRYHRSGSSDSAAPAVLCVHGFGASACHWRKNLPALGESCRAYAIDLLGYGYSDKVWVGGCMACGCGWVGLGGAAVAACRWAGLPPAVNSHGPDPPPCRCLCFAARPAVPPHQLNLQLSQLGPPAARLHKRSDRRPRHPHLQLRRRPGGPAGAVLCCAVPCRRVAALPRRVVLRRAALRPAVVCHAVLQRAVLLATLLNVSAHAAPGDCERALHCAAGRNRFRHAARRQPTQGRQCIGACRGARHVDALPAKRPAPPVTAPAFPHRPSPASAPGGDR